MGKALNVSSHYLSIILVCSLVDKFIERQMLFRIAVFGRKLSLTNWKSQAIHDLRSTCASSVSNFHCTRASGCYIERRCLHQGNITSMAKNSDWSNNDSIRLSLKYPINLKCIILSYINIIVFFIESYSIIVLYTLYDFVY